MTVPFMPAFHADLLMRPVKFVRAKGGVFICGGAQSLADDAGATVDWVTHRNQMVKEQTANWLEVFRKAESTHIFPYCGAYGAVGANPTTGTLGAPTFIIAGARFRIYGSSFDDPTNNQQIIMTSIGGEVWSETHRENEGYCVAAGWDETNKRFLVQCIADNETGTYEFNYVVLASSDGVGWSRVASVPGVGFGNYGHPLLIATGTPLVQDEEGQNVPNGGYYGWDKAKDIIITPEVLLPYFASAAGSGATNKIEIIKKQINPETGVVTTIRTKKPLPIDLIHCTAYAGGIWQAGGTMDDDDGLLKIATSIDDGDTWQLDYSVPNSTAICLMGAPPEMFS